MEAFLSLMLYEVNNFALVPTCTRTNANAYVHSIVRSLNDKQQLSTVSSFHTAACADIDREINRNEANR